MKREAEADKEFFACLAFRHAQGIGPRTWKKVFKAYDSAYLALLDADSWAEKGIASRRQANAIINEKWREGAKREYHAAHDAGMKVLCWHHPHYPPRLRTILEPPALLYYAGDSNLLRNPGVAVVGARKCTHFGLDAAENISFALAKLGVTIVSGLALGIDRQAHLAGLRGLGRSIAVLGAGLDQDYPADNGDVRQALERRGCVVTEFAPGLRPEPSNFPFRNRIISGLSLGVLVAEAANRSGSLITARLAAEEGREVFALPGPLGQPTFTGCHGLIKQGAALVESAEDILEILRYQFAEELSNCGSSGDEGVEECADIATLPSRIKGQSPLAVTPKKSSKKRAPLRKALVFEPDEQEVMDLLEAEEKLHVDALCRALGWHSAKVSRMLTMLEIRGAIRQLPGMWYLAKEPHGD